jgi:hypothetical protein
MSGGHFNHKQFAFAEIAEQISDVLETEANPGVNQWGERTDYGFRPDTLDNIKSILMLVKIAQVYVSELDYLLSSDTSEDSFFSNINDRLDALHLQHREY